MSIAACFFASTVSLPNNYNNINNFTPKLILRRPSPLLLPHHLHLHLPLPHAGITASTKTTSPFLVFSSGGDGNNSINNNNDNNNNNNNGGNGGNGEGGGEDAGGKNVEEAMMVLAEAERSLESLPKDLAAAIGDGRIPGAVLTRYFELEKSGLFRWLMHFGGFKERLLADDLFLAKVFIECGVGIFTKTAAEYNRRRENFFNELEIVFADVVMAIIADFMLVYLPAPTVSLRSSVAASAGPIAKFFHNCPDNAFQVALAGTSYSFLHRLGAIARNGAKLFAVGTTSSLVGTAVTNAFINARKTVNNNAAAEVENVPIFSTSAAYGVYMAVSSNLRYQVLAGVIEQRILEPLLHKHKLILSAVCFAVRTGNTYLGSLLWVDYARLIGIQKAHDEEKALSAVNDEL
ncbi:protein RETICULATA-RELATED 4, chloroplastic-like [Mangifera indica]|uniref:protein RETICULATA-RELATED 4, chloroplastic-like n=1 Tax=Mangifera indica TaxID=29780 RepID=UPI001CF9DC89|nr:protein RETICULATA-RELATED 4, chloroplastic-like [Mangifera indica]